MFFEIVVRIFRKQRFFIWKLRTVQEQNQKRERNFEWKQQFHAAAPMKPFSIPIGSEKNPFGIGWWFTDWFCQEIRKSAIFCMKHSGWAGAVNIRKVYENGKFQLRPARLLRFVRNSLENLDQIKKSCQNFKEATISLMKTSAWCGGNPKKEKENVFDRSIDRSNRNRNQSRMAGSRRSRLWNLQQLQRRLKGGTTWASRASALAVTGSRFRGNVIRILQKTKKAVRLLRRAR